MTLKAYGSVFFEEQAIILQAGHLEAIYLPARGGNLIALRDLRRGYRFLREPDRRQMNGEFQQNPNVFGIPVLFPPNRIDQGRFTWGDHTYTFALNEKQWNNSLHGILNTATWEIKGYGSNDEDSYVTGRILIDAEHPLYQVFPHKFAMEITYRLSEAGLTQEITVENLGDDAMPLMLGFHTSIQIPFLPYRHKDHEHYRIKIPVRQRYSLNDRMLPTQETEELSPFEIAMGQQGVRPYPMKLDSLYQAPTGDGFHEMCVIDDRHHVSLRYQVDDAFPFWMVWNHFGKPGLFCPEPQTCLVNAPNLDMPPTESGMITMNSRQVWKAKNRILIELTSLR